MSADQRSDLRVSESSTASEDSLTLFRQLADSMRFIVWSATADGAVDYSNRYFFEYTGLPEDSEPATRWQPCVHPEDMPRVIPVWQRSVTTGEPYRVDFRIKRASDGVYRWFRVSAEPVLSDAGRVARWYGTGIDVDEPKQLQLQATQYARRLAATFEAISDGFIAADVHEKVTYANAQIERLLYVDRSSLLGRSLWDALPESITRVARATIERARESNERAAIEVYDEPMQRWIDLRVYPSEDGVALFFCDDTDRRRSLDELRDQATLLDHAQDAIFVQDSDRKITYWNSGAERLLGWTRAQALGHSTESILGVEPATLLVATQEVIERGSWAGELEIRTSQRNAKTVASRWSLMRANGEKSTRILAINTDITQQKSVEAQLFRAQRLESIGTLAGGIAHDLNNILTPILTSIEMLRDGERDADKLSDLDTLDICAKRGAAMVRQLLHFARGTTAGTRVDVDLAEVARDVLRIVRDTFPKDVHGKLTATAGQWRVRADATQMHQLLMNLCVNARDAMPNGGALSVCVEAATIDEVYAGMNVDARPGPYVVVRVEDTGTGIPPELLERIFDPFFTTKEVGRGTGLGLSTCHAIVRSHSGFIHVYSEIGRGTRFKVYFPAIVPSDRAASAESSERIPRGDGQLILVVDDEEPIRKVTARTLERYGYRAITAANGAEAVALFATHRASVALVLTDMSMPVMDGAAEIVALRSMDPEVKIIACSGLDSNGNNTRGKSEGVVDFLSKPYSASTLLHAMHRALG